MVAMNFFNEFANHLGQGTVDLRGPLNVVLSTDIDATWATYASVTGELAEANGYTAGGFSLGSDDTPGTLEYQIFDDSGTGIRLAAVGGDIGPFRYVIIYDSGSGTLICYADNGSSATITDGNDLLLEFPAGIILTVQAPG